MEKVYSELDLMVFSSDYVPMIVLFGPSEIVVDDVNGYFIPMSDVEVLAEGMYKCLNKRWDVAKIRESAEKFQVDKIAEEYQKVLMEA